MLLFDKSVDLKTLSPLTLAYIGDGVYELMIREYLLYRANCGAGKLHSKAVGYVNAAYQAKAMQLILPLLEEKELAVYKRGRNAHTGHVPKAVTSDIYHTATAFECLFGYIYLSDNIERLQFLFNTIIENIEQ